MKLKHLVTICLLASGLAAAAAQGVNVNLPGSPATQPAFTDEQLIEEFGWFIGKRVGLTELEFTPAEIELLLKGFRHAAAGKDSPYPLEKVGPPMDAFMQKKQAAYVAKLKNKNQGANQEFFAKLKENKAVVGLPSGLRYEIVKAGEGRAPKATETVRVHYVGKLIDGTEFDSSVKRGEPAEFPLNQVIPGWTEGIQKMQKGGKIRLYVPPDLAYGDDGRPGIPPGSTLIFDVELLDIKAPAGMPAAAPKPAKK